MTQIRRFKVDKLIRDKMPEMMRASGGQVLERVMERDEYLKRLKDKLVEEAKEVMESSGEKEMQEELADLLEVMLTLVKVHGLEFSSIHQKAEEKKVEKGGFDQRFYVDFIEVE